VNQQQPTYRDGRGKLERFLEDYSGWGRLLITLLFLAIQAGYFVSKLESQSKAQEDNALVFRTQVREFNDNIKDLAGQVNRMAISNEHLSVQMLENRERLNDTTRRVEKLEDGRRR